MIKIVASMLALVMSPLFALTACHAKDLAPDLRIIATIRVQVPASDAADLRKTVADFAGEHGFSRGEESTMPRNRKIFLMAGAFSTTFRSKDDYYLLVHNLVGKDCILIDLYATRNRTSYQQLMADLRQAIKTALPDKAKIVNKDVCSD